MEIDGSVYREKFLDNFPLSETEVDCLISLYNSSCEVGNDGGTTSYSLSHLCQQLPSQMTTENACYSQDEWFSRLQHVEETIVPDVTDWLNEAPESVCPLLPYDILDDKTTSPVCRAFYFLEAMVSLLGRRGTRFLTNFVYDRAMKQNKNGKGGADPDILVESVYRHLLAALYLKDSSGNKPGASGSLLLEAPKAWTLSLKESAGVDTKTVSRTKWTAWVSDVTPEVLRGLSTFYHHALFPPGTPYGLTSPPPFSLPKPDQEQLFWGPDFNLLLPLSLSCISPVLSGPWYRLYSSNWDGSSFLSFQNALLSYSGPTVLLVRAKGSSNGVFGYYTDCPWRESNTWFGGEGHDSFLFKFDTALGVYWPTWEVNGHYMYLNTSPQNVPNHHARGLMIGGISSETPRVHLPPSLENCRAMPTDTTYGSGPLLEDAEMSPFFDVDAMEVWAVNVTEAEFLQNQAAGQKQMARKEEARQRVAHVDRKQFLDDFQSGAYVNNLYSHRDQARGRHDFVASDTGKGYFLEGKLPSEKALSPRHDLAGGRSHDSGKSK